MEMITLEITVFNSELTDSTIREIENIGNVLTVTRLDK
jgi:hypothetical protein